MKKSTAKQIRDIAKRLPKVMERHMSGGLWDIDETGKEAFVPNIYDVEVNHERRLRRAYERMGMDGIKSYLESIHKLQKETHAKALGNSSAGQTVPVSDKVEDMGGNSLLENEIENTQSTE